MPSVPPLVAANEIGGMLGVSRQRVTQLASAGHLPRARGRALRRTHLAREDIVDWADRTGRTLHDG